MKRIICSLFFTMLISTAALATETISPTWKPVYESVEFTCYADTNTLQYNAQTKTATVSLVMLINQKGTKDVAKLKIDYNKNTVVIPNEEIYKEYGKTPQKVNGKVQPTTIIPDTPTAEITDNIKALVH